MQVIKFFVLSVLWRASVCKRKEFKGIDLGAKISQKARRAILKKNLQHFPELDIAISRFDNGVSGFLLPIKNTFDGVNRYHMLLPF
nr:hypothetical protein [Legionella jordanis]